MAGLTPRPGGGRRRSRRHMAEINVTPFVDVMLVLLIVFMVAAPLMSVGVQVDLPETAAPDLPTESQSAIRLQVSQGGGIFLENDEIKLDDLTSILAERYGDQAANKRVYVLGDQSASHGDVMRVMAVLQRAGYAKITFPTESAAQAAE